ncbi:MAG: indole-3-glycerol phosphate synthase TrpC [Bacteroidetes bacterium]|jgi:indole-3-glycerol phosphate synthase|nr:MAG: indole-3-glycerol phosphate synthase TrpC [Bacteroidota bacterium]
MSILGTIIIHKRSEVEERKSLYPVKLLEKSPYFTSPCVSLRQYLTRPDLSGVIAEFKRKSPSKGDINPYASVEQVSVGYMQAGASALSILTDKTFFGGKNEDLSLARRMNYCPILRKDFTIDEYQIVEARSIGADAILLIAAVLGPEEIRRLAAFARSLGMETLLEVHDKEELTRSLCDEVDLVGVNNRNLKDFSLSLDTSLSLAEYIPDTFVKVTESGIHSPEQARMLRGAGYQGFLIGEQFMKTARPEQACAKFIRLFHATAHAN